MSAECRRLMPRHGPSVLAVCSPSTPAAGCPSWPIMLAGPARVSEVDANGRGEWQLRGTMPTTSTTSARGWRS
jgi:hypothetical protein